MLNSDEKLVNYNIFIVDPFLLFSFIYLFADDKKIDDILTVALSNIIT